MVSPVVLPFCFISDIALFPFLCTFCSVPFIFLFRGSSSHAGSTCHTGWCPSSHYVFSPSLWPSTGCPQVCHPHHWHIFSIMPTVALVRLAQSVEHETRNLKVVGLWPTLGTTCYMKYKKGMHASASYVLVTQFPVPKGSMVPMQQLPNLQFSCCRFYSHFHPSSPCPKSL